MYNGLPTIDWWVPHEALDQATAVWEPDDYDHQRALALVSETSTVENRQQSWHQMGLWNGTLYSNRELPGFHWGITLETDSELTPANLVTENLVQSIGDSMLAKASSDPLMPTAIPRGASFKTKRLIKELNRWIYGTWRQLKCEDLAAKAFLDAYICGTGCVRVDYDQNGLCAEAVFYDNVIVDNRECLNRAPALTYRLRSVVPKAAVEGLFGVKLAEVDSSYVSYRDIGREWVVLVEAWRMPIGKKGEDGYQPGRHVISCGGVLCKDDPWTLPKPPLVFLSWQDPISGFYAPSGVECVVPYQIRLNEINEHIKAAQDLTVNPRLLVHAGSRVDINNIDDQPGRTVMYTGVKPEPLLWPAVPAEFYNERERVVKSAYEFFGISQLSASAQLPAGVRLDSSEAVREFKLSEDTRFLPLWTRFEAFRMEIAQRMVDVMCMDPERTHATVWHPGGRAKAMSIKWEDVKHLKQDHFTWSMDALPLASMSPAAREDKLAKWVEDGLIGPDERRQMTDHPDLEGIQDLETASISDVHRHIELMEDGKFEAPDAMTNLVYGVPKVTYNIADLKTYDEYEAGDPDMMDCIEAHHEWLRIADALQNPVVNEPTDQPGGPGPVAGMAGATPNPMAGNSPGFPGQALAAAGPMQPMAPLPPGPPGAPQGGPPMPPQGPLS